MKKIYVKPYIIPIMLVNSSQKHKSKKKKPNAKAQHRDKFKLYSSQNTIIG